MDGLSGNVGSARVHRAQLTTQDNAKAESFMKTLKYEEVHRVEYKDLAEVRRGMRTFLERTYNQRRLHSALGYRPPAEFDGLAENAKVPA